MNDKIFYPLQEIEKALKKKKAAKKPSVSNVFTSLWEWEENEREYSKSDTLLIRGCLKDSKSKTKA